MAIDQRRYVDIASAVVGATAVAMQKLDFRVMTPNIQVASNSILEFSGALQVAEYFGADTEEAEIARNYFAYVSPAPVSRPKAIQFAAHVTTARDAGVLGGAQIGTISQLNAFGDATALTASITYADGTTEQSTGTPALSAVVSYADVATALTAAFTASDVVITFSYEQIGGRGVFVATLPAGQYATVNFGTGSLAQALGLDYSQSTFEPGSSVKTMIESYNDTVRNNDSFGSIYFMEQGGIDEIVDVAEANAAFNVKHQLYIDVAPAGAAILSAALIGTASVGLILRREADDVTLAVLPAAIMSATDYNRTNATTNYMFRQNGVTFQPQVTTDLDANVYDPIRVNYYGRTAVAGSNIEFFQRAFLCGGVSAPVDMSVHANEQWLKAYIAQQWFTLLISTRGIPANLDGAARMRIVIADAVTRALDNGTILPGKTLTSGQKIAVTDAAGDDLAWHDVQDKGYWYDVSITEQTGPSNLPEYVGQYTLIYGKGDWVRKVSGSHNLV